MMLLAGEAFVFLFLLSPESLCLLQTVFSNFQIVKMPSGVMS